LKPDLVYCVNVLQHTANPRETFARLAKLLGKESFFLFNIYLRRSEAAFLFVRAVRRAIRLLPFSIWKWLSFSIATVAYPLSKVRFLRRPIQRLLPISHSFRETWLDVYDAYGGHFYQENMTRSEQLRMIVESGLKITKESKYGYLLTPSQQQ
jgi:hypothetical protein